MAVSSNQSGSQTATISTEHQLGTTITAAGVYVLVVDTNAMAAGDRLELRIKSKSRSADAERQAACAVFEGAQIDPIKHSIPVPTDCDFSATLKQTAGTGRAYPWNILSL